MLHFYLFSILPVLYIYCKNIDSFPVNVLYWPCLLILVICSLVHVFVALVLKNEKKWFLFLSSVVLLFWFSWPLAVRVTHIINIQNNFILTYKFAILSLTVCLLALICWWLTGRLKSSFPKLNQLLNIFACIIVLNQIFSIIRSEVSQSYTSVASEPKDTTKDSDHPNIYHIILDAYTNKDILYDIYGYDNSDFYDTLRSYKFQVLDSSYSNYPATTFSVNSMLNMEYYSNIESIPQDSNVVWEHLKAIGYRIHAYLGFITIPNYPKVYLSKTQSDNADYLFIITCFNFTPIHHTLHNLFLKKVYQAHIDEIDQTLHFLEGAKDHYGDSNHYFYAHIVSPHEPFIFDAEGNVSSEQTYEGFVLQQKLNLANDPACEKRFQEGYINQIQAINKRALKVIEKILSQYTDSQKPIIILHGDHGRSSRFLSDREWEQGKEETVPPLYLRAHWGNLFAIHGTKQALPENLTLINLYKYLFNDIFKENNLYLENKHFSFTRKLIEYKEFKYQSLE